jgi:cyclic pyranopterin monophosphate synthase
MAARKRSPKLTHLDASGRARMVDVGDKPITARMALARGSVRMQPETLALLRSGKTTKGDVLAVARIAGIQASKRTPELIPLCHGIALTRCEVRFEVDVTKSTVHIEAETHALDRTGVEMEALTAVSVAALTIYDMLKAVDRRMVIGDIALHEKRGGKSGEFVR